MKNPYIPSKKILENYANILVNFALRGGKGIKKGDVVVIRASEACKPLYIELVRAVRKAGGHVISRYRLDDGPDVNLTREFYLSGTDEQIKFYPKNLLEGEIKDADHVIAIIADADMHSMKGVDPKKMMMRGEVMEPLRRLENEKENKGKFSWTVALYGTEAMAKEAGISLKEYWQQIIKACFLDKKDPIAEWQKVNKDLSSMLKKINKLKIEKVHVEGPDADLWVRIGEKRLWKGGVGNNIPSFEIFTSPDWRGVEGWIRFNQPLYRYGNLIEGVELQFKGGRVVKAKAKKNEKVLKAMIETKNADKAGEFSLTDRRFSRIERFMAETLYDENIGGENGNTHLALGSAYKDCYDGDPSKVSKKEWERLGYNESSVHTDIMSTAPRTVTAYLSNGKSLVIYKDGQFTL